MTGNTNNKGLIPTEDVYDLDIDTVRSLYKEYVNPGIEDILFTFACAEELIDHAEGVWIYYKNGQRKVFDATGGLGVLNLGHNHPRILKVRTDFQKMKRMEVHKALFSQYTAALCHNLAAILDRRLQYSFLCNSGAEAVEGAIKAAYKFHDGKRSHILHSDISYHGKLLGSGSITASKEVPFKFPSIPGTHAFTYNSIESVRQKVRELRTTKQTSDIYAIIVEPYSISALIPCTDEFLRELRVLCDENNIVLIFDEVFSGWFKMGPLFYFQKSGVYPDILTLSKTMGGGKSSISAFITKADIFKASFGNVSNALLHSTTYNGFGEECITAIEAINIMFDENHELKTQQIEQIMNEWLQSLQSKFPDRILSYSGCGSLFAFQLKILPGVLNKISHIVPLDLAKDGKLIDKIESAAFCDFLFINYDIHALFGGQNDVRIYFAPAVIVSFEDLTNTHIKIEKAISEFSISDIVAFAARKFKKSVF